MPKWVCCYDIILSILDKPILDYPGLRNCSESRLIQNFLRSNRNILNTNNDFFILNVGFVLHENIGYHRDFYYDIPTIVLDPELNLSDLSGSVRVTRTARGLLLQIKMTAGVRLVCVRCLEEYNQNLEIDTTEVFAFSPDEITDLGLLLPEDGRIDLESIVRDEMLLAIPIKPLCTVNCKGLCPVCGENRNLVECHHDDQPVDPRLAGLSALLQNEQTK
jgi:uncharacterized protein